MDVEGEKNYMLVDGTPEMIVAVVLLSRSG